MLILIYGDDDFRVQEKVKQIKTAFLNKFDNTGINLQSFPPNDSIQINIGDILQAACSYPFLGKKRMVLVRGLIGLTNKDDQEPWVQGFGRIPATTIAVLWECAPPKALERKSLFKALSNMSDVYKYQFYKLDDEKLKQWIIARISAKGATIHTNALHLLIERVGNDLWQMSQEIDKLIAYAKDNVILREMVDELVGASFESKIFELMDVISQKRRNNAWKLLQEERLSDSHDQYLMTMLGRQVRILLSARTMLDENPYITKYELATKLSLPPFVAQKVLVQAKAYSFDELNFVHEQLYDFDFKIKTSRISADLAVDLIVEQLMRS